MSKTPIEMMLDGVTWVETEAHTAAAPDDGIPYATHSGVFEVLGHKLRCYRLSDGKAVFNADDFEQMFATLNV